MSLAEFNDLALATLEAYHDDLADTIHSGSPTYMYMQEAGIVSVQPTEGASFIRPLIAKDAPEPLWFRYADAHTWAPIDTGEAARFRYYNVRMPIAVTEEELKENRGVAKRLDLLGMKVKAAELTLRDRYNKAWIWNRSTYVHLYGGNSANLPEGIPYIFGQVPGTGTAAPYRTYGEIARSTGAGHATWWRSQNRPATATAGALSTDLRALFMDCSRDGFRPGLLLCNQPAYLVLGRLLENRVQLNVDVTGGKAPRFDGGFEGLTYYGAQVRWDPSILGLHGDGASTDGVIFMLNSDFWGLVEDDEWNWLLLPFEEPKGNDTQLVRQSFIVHRCTMFHDNPRFCGLLFDISTNQT